MSTPVDREGTFRAEITAYGLREMESGSMCVSLHAKLLHMWNGEEWEPWSEYDMEAQGDVWIVKTDGNLNQRAAESLIKCAGWNGDIESIVSESWQPTPCQVVIQNSEYKGVSKLKIAFVNDFDRTPGGLSNIDANKAKALNMRFGSQLRALAGNVKRNAPPPSTKPTPPPRLKVHETPATSGNGLAPAEKYEDIPF